MQWVSSLMGIVTEEPPPCSPYDDASAATLVSAEGSYKDRTVGVVSSFLTRLNALSCGFPRSKSFCC